jgi:hypothetical protein
MLLPFNTSTFSNILNVVDCAAQCHALVAAPFQDLFNANSKDVLQFTEKFTQRCQETSVLANFDLITNP